MSTTQPITGANPMETDHDAHHQTPPPSPTVPPSSSPPISTIVGSSAPSLPDASSRQMPSLGRGMGSGSVGGTSVAEGTTSNALVGSKDSTAGAKIAKPKGGLNVSVSQPNRTASDRF